VCASISTERNASREVREASRQLVKHSQELVDRADVPMREIEETRSADRAQMQRFCVALAGLRGAMQQITDVQFRVRQRRAESAYMVGAVSDSMTELVANQ
jgi:hypothetical protein